MIVARLVFALLFAGWTMFIFVFSLLVSAYRCDENCHGGRGSDWRNTENAGQWEVIQNFGFVALACGVIVIALVLFGRRWPALAAWVAHVVASAVVVALAAPRALTAWDPGVSPFVIMVALSGVVVALLARPPSSVGYAPLNTALH